MANKLDVWKVVTGAFLIPWRNRATFAIALANPVLLIATLTLSWHYAKKYFSFPDWLNWGFDLLYIILFTMLAVTCHRLVLLKLEHITSFIGLRWSSRETRFFLWIVAFCLVFIGGFMLLFMLSVSMSSLWLNTNLVDSLLSVFYMAAKIFPWSIFARLSLIFPALAIDKKLSLKEAWRLTKGNGWRLAFIVGGLPWILSELIHLLYHDEASIFEAIILTVLATALFVVEIAAISLSYYELAKNDQRLGI
jgi:hypothetical protein